MAPVLCCAAMCNMLYALSWHGSRHSCRQRHKAAIELSCAVLCRRLRRPQAHDQQARPSSASRGLLRPCRPPKLPMQQLSSLQHQADQRASLSSARLEQTTGPLSSRRRPTRRHRRRRLLLATAHREPLRRRLIPSPLSRCGHSCAQGGTSPVTAERQALQQAASPLLHVEAARKLEMQQFLQAPYALLCLRACCGTARQLHGPQLSRDQAVLCRSLRRRQGRARLASPSSARMDLLPQSPPLRQLLQQHRRLPAQADQPASPSSARRAQLPQSHQLRQQLQRLRRLPAQAGQPAHPPSAKAHPLRARSVLLPPSQAREMSHSPAPQTCLPSRTGPPTRATWTPLTQTGQGSKPPQQCGQLLISCNRARRVLLARRIRASAA